VLGEDRQGDLVGVECTCGAGVGLQVDEQLDNLVLGDTAAEGDPELPAQRFMSAQGGRDGHRNECPAAIVQAGAAPGVAERVLGGQPPEVGARGRFTGPEREDQGLAEQPPGGIEGVLVSAAGARWPGRRVVRVARAGPGSRHDDLAFLMRS
jgi:hypothetical protein